MENYLEIKSIIKKRYVYVDTKDYKADSIIFGEGIKMKIIKEFHIEGEKYCLIYCKVRKDDSIRFEVAMEKLKDKMLVCGHNDYEEWCENTFNKLFGKG